MSAPTPAGRDVAHRLIHERGPIPDHLVQSLAKRLAKAKSEPKTVVRTPAA